MTAIIIILLLFCCLCLYGMWRQDRKSTGIRVVCAWCPDSQKQTRKLTAAGYQVTHGICPACRAKILSKN